MQVKKVFLTVMAALTCCLVQAQTAPLLLGKSHAMQRVHVEKKYVLQQVQDREESDNLKEM